MFSCLLLHSESHTKPVVAQKCDVNVQVVGLVGRGKASATFALDRDYKDLFLYVPSMIVHRDATRQQVRLSNCQIRTQGRGDARTHSLHLESIEYSRCVRRQPELKRRYKDLLSSYCGAHSCEDVLLHIGDLPSGCELRVDFEFLAKFSATASSSSHYLVHNKIPSEFLSYTLSLASSLKVEGVVPISVSTCTPTHSLQWAHLDDQSQNVVQVSYEFLSSTTDRTLSPYSSGFEVKLAEGISSGCCCSLSPKLESTQSSIAQFQRSNNSYDGVMMLNSTFSREQLPTSLQQMSLFPSEFVFVVDCSGSMSGTNIQAAADTLITCVKSLPEGCYFNVIAFGSTFRQLFHTSSEYSKKSVVRAVQFANQLQASLGGTELLAPLRWIFKRSRCSGLPCQMFIITDGGVTNTQTVLHTVRKNRHQARYDFV